MVVRITASKRNVRCFMRDSDMMRRLGQANRQSTDMLRMMRPDMVYQFPIWAVGLSLAIVAVIGTILLELGGRHFVSATFRRQHNDIAAAIFSIIGVTYAVLLAFVAMLAWEGYNRAKAASYAEATLIGDVYNLSAGFADPEKSSIRNEILGYARRVATVEWPAGGRTHGRSGLDLPQ